MFGVRNTAVVEYRRSGNIRLSEEKNLGDFAGYSDEHILKMRTGKHKACLPIRND